MITRIEQARRELDRSNMAGAGYWTLHEALMVLEDICKSTGDLRCICCIANHKRLLAFTERGKTP